MAEHCKRIGADKPPDPQKDKGINLEPMYEKSRKGGMASKKKTTS